MIVIPLGTPEHWRFGPVIYLLKIFFDLVNILLNILKIIGVGTALAQFNIYVSKQN